MERGGGRREGGMRGMREGREGGMRGMRERGDKWSERRKVNSLM